MVKTGRYTRRNYTIVELLMVILVMAILMGISAAGLTTFIKHQGAAGGVRVIGNQLNLARSYAVSKNRYVAVLFPDKDNTSGFTDKHILRKTLICFVKKVSTTNYEFDGWVEGEEWYEQADGTLANISTSSKIVDFNPPGSIINGLTPAVVYSPTGALVECAPIQIKVYRAHYDTINHKITYDTKTDKGWIIKINPFTGRASYAKEN
ncbi:MAG: hypothetical protein WC071_11965 [Victivallaceae bacterium]